MAYSILDIGNDTRKQALTGLRDAANREEQRDQANQNLRNAERQKTMSAVGAGASIGMMVGGPVGAGVGAAAGLVIGEVF